MFKKAGFSHTTQGYLIAVLSAAILSTTGIFIRHLTQACQLPPLVLAFWRDALVALTLLPILGLFSFRLLRVSGRKFLFLIGYGLVLAVFNSLWTFSVALNGAAVSTVLVYCSAGFTALLGWWLFKERLNWARLVAVALCLGGCVLVSGALDPAAWQSNLAGIVTGVISGLAYAVYTLMGRSAAQQGINPWTAVLYTFGCAAGFLLLFNLTGGLLPGTAVHPAALALPGSDWTVWGLLLMLAAGPTLIGFGLYNVSLGYLPSGVANLVVTLEPAFTAVIAYFLLGERLTGIQFGGSLLILSGVVFLRLYEEGFFRGVAGVAVAGE